MLECKKQFSWPFWHLSLFPGVVCRVQPRVSPEGKGDKLAVDVDMGESDDGGGKQELGGQDADAVV